MMNTKLVKRLMSDHGVTQGELARKVGIDQSAISKILTGRRQVKTDELQRIATALETNVLALLSGGGAQNHHDMKPQSYSRPIPNVDMSTAHTLPIGERDLPVYGQVRGGSDGVVIIDPTDGPIDWVFRPPTLAGVRNAYAVYIEGDSMEPRYFHGELVWVHPTKPARPGDDVVVIYENNEAVIKRLVRRTAREVTLAQYNPAKEIISEPGAVRSIHVVVGRTTG